MRILSTDLGHITFNNNIQGNLAKALLHSITSEDQHELANFRILMGKYNSFFDGILQRDVLESLNYLIEILHDGTKKNLIDLEFELDDDSFVTSLAKNLFTCTIKKTFKCNICYYGTVRDENTQYIYLYPKNTPSSISELLNQSFYGQIARMCEECSAVTEHAEVSAIEYCLDILVIVINRFDVGNHTRKNRTNITLERKLCHNFKNYDLIGSVHHLGDSTTSGHYTSKIYHTDIVYNCNDHIITEIVPSDANSDNAYLLFYKYSSQP